MKNRKNSVKMLLGIGAACVIVLFAAVLLTLNVKKNAPIPSEAYENVKTTWIHYSIDDSNDVFEDLTKHQNRYSSCFEQKELAFLKRLHDQYGIAVSLYVFYSWDVSDSGSFNLSQATDKYAKEFSDNADWLRFGFHAIDAREWEHMSPERQEEYYDLTIKELIRITGSEDCIDNYVRLDRFLGDEESIALLKNIDQGIVGLYTADDEERDSYYLSVEERARMQADGIIWVDGIAYTPTDIRLEKIENESELLYGIERVKPKMYVSVFTHERNLNNKVKHNFEQMAQWMKTAGIESGFPEDYLFVRAQENE